MTVFYQDWLANEEDRVPHCCLFCGWVPIEGMFRYLGIHGHDARCIACERLLPHPPGPFIDPLEQFVACVCGWRGWRVNTDYDRKSNEERCPSCHLATSLKL